MFIEDYPLDADLPSRAEVDGPPVLILRVTRRGGQKTKLSLIIYYEHPTKGHYVCLVDRNHKRVYNTSLAFKDTEEVVTPRHTAEKMKWMANTWGTTVEDLIDRIFDERPETW